MNRSGLSAARSGEDQQRPFGVENGLSLAGIESLEEVHDKELIVAQCPTTTTLPQHCERGVASSGYNYLSRQYGSRLSSLSDAGL